MAKTLTDRALEAVCCSGQEIGGGLKELTIVPWGTVRSKNGDFILDDEAAGAIIAAFDAHGVAVPIDWEHESLGGKGRVDAAGWIERIWAVPGVGLKALVKWTEKAREVIRSDAYRYLSPVLLIRKDDRRAVNLHSVGLTNLPAIPAMERVAASSRTFVGKETKTMADEPAGTTTDQEKVLLLLGQVIKEYDLKIEGDAGPVAVLEALLAKGGGKKEGEGEGEGGDKAVASKAVIEALGAKEDAGESELLVAINTLKQGKESMAAMTAKLDGLEQKLAGRDAEEALRPHIEAGKINPNDAEDVKVCRQLAMSDRAAFDHQMAHRLPNPPPGRTTAPDRPATGGRETMMVNAVQEYEGDPKLERLSSKAAFVDGTLREHNLAPLTDDERKKIST